MPQGPTKLDFCKLAKGELGAVGEEVEVEGTLFGDLYHLAVLSGKDCVESISIDFQDWSKLRPKVLEIDGKTPAGHSIVLTLVGKLSRDYGGGDRPDYWLLTVKNSDALKSVHYAPSREVLHPTYFEFPPDHNRE